MIAIALISPVVFGQTAADLSRATSDWQSISLGTSLTVDCPSKKSKGAEGNVYYSLDIAVKIENKQANPASYDLDIFFVAVKNKDAYSKGLKARDKKSAQISLSAGTSTNLNFHAMDEVGGDKVTIPWTGYIVRLSAFGKPIKIVASGKDLERLATDSEKMAALEAGKIVPAK